MLRGPSLLFPAFQLLAFPLLLGASAGGATTAYGRLGRIDQAVSGEDVVR